MPIWWQKLAQSGQLSKQTNNKEYCDPPPLANYCIGISSFPSYMVPALLSPLRRPLSPLFPEPFSHPSLFIAALSSAIPSIPRTILVDSKNKVADNDNETILPLTGSEWACKEDWLHIIFNFHIRLHWQFPCATGLEKSCQSLLFTMTCCSLPKGMIFYLRKVNVDIYSKSPLDNLVLLRGLFNAFLSVLWRRSDEVKF